MKIKTSIAEERYSPENFRVALIDERGTRAMGFKAFIYTPQIVFNEVAML